MCVKVCQMDSKRRVNEKLGRVSKEIIHFGCHGEQIDDVWKLEVIKLRNLRKNWNFVVKFKKLINPE